MDVTEQTFEAEVIERSRSQPVVVDFWAEWCGPCKVLAPVLVQSVAERDGRLTLVKVDVEANPGLAAEYRIRGIPAVKAFRNGSVVGEFTGVRSAQLVASFLDELLGPSAGERVLAELRERGDRPDVVAALEAGDHERALSLLLDEISRTDGDGRDEIRRLMVALFAELGQDDPLAPSYRRRLAAALY